MFGILLTAAVAGVFQPAPAAAQDSSDFAGRWTLNRGASEFPREIGFDANWAAAGSAGDTTTTSGRGGRGGRGSSGGGVASPFSAPLESAEDAKRVQQLTAEVRNPSARLTVVDTPSAVTVTDDRGQTRTFHPDGRDTEFQLDGVPVVVNARREPGRLVVVYRVEQGRELRYTYSYGASPRQLVIAVQFLDHGKGDAVRRVYDPASAETAPAVAAGSAAGSPTAAQTFNQQPDAELKGLTNLGLVVEDLSSQAGACGLSQGTLETAVTKHLTDAGFRVRRNSDEDTYVYVNIITSSLTSTLCVSRYDVFVYTHTTAKLSYQDAPVLIEVSLLHKGGLAGGVPAQHADGVVRGVQEIVDQFSTRIRAANK